MIWRLRETGDKHACLPERSPPPERTPGRLRRVPRLILFAVTAATVGLAGLSFTDSWTIRRVTVASASMEPTLQCSNAPGCLGTRDAQILASSLPYLLSSPHRGDMVVIDFGHAPHHCAGDTLVKRIIGLPGDVIGQRNGHLFVNGQRLFESYLPRGQSAGPDFAARRLPSTVFFVMGDNRNHSCDSRQFGPVPRRLIRAKVVVTL